MKRRLRVGLALSVGGWMSRPSEEGRVLSEWARGNSMLTHFDANDPATADATLTTIPADLPAPSSSDGVSAETPAFVARPARYLDRKKKAELLKLEDAELLTRFQDGDEHAFYVLFERRHKEIYTHCFRMCSGDSEKANDAFQDTFVKVFTRKDLFTDASNGRAWLYRIATNTCLNQHRYDKRHPTETIDESVPTVDARSQPDFNTEQDSLRIALDRAVGKLPMELREPFMVRELEEFSYEEVAEQLGISVAACRQRVYRAKQTLREELQEVVTGEAPKQATPIVKVQERSTPKKKFFGR